MPDIILSVSIRGKEVRELHIQEFRKDLPGNATTIFIGYGFRINTRFAKVIFGISAISFPIETERLVTGSTRGNSHNLVNPAFARL